MLSLIKDDRDRLARAILTILGTLKLKSVETHLHENNGVENLHPSTAFAVAQF